MNNDNERDCRNCRYYGESVVRGAVCLLWGYPITTFKQQEHIRLIPCEDYAAAQEIKTDNDNIDFEV